MIVAPRKLARKVVSFAVVLVLTTSMGQAVALAQEAERQFVELQKEKSVPTRDLLYTPIHNPRDQDAFTAAEPASFPAAARGEVDFAGPGGTPAQAAARAAGTPIRAAGTPVAVGLDRSGQATARQAATGKVAVEVREPSSSAVVFSLTDAGGARDKPLEVAFDYSSFASLGGDYASRLRLVSLPGCAVSTPEKAECQVVTPVEGAENDVATRSLSGKATLKSAEPVVLAAVAAASGPAGSFAATSLAPAGSWSAGGASGDFAYGYPMRVPPAVGGAAPSVSLGYSAQSLDGRTSSTNNQASWAGDGWDLSPAGFIERQYKPCGLDLGGNNGQTKTGDQCWDADNATISLVGVSGRMIRKGDTNEWRAESDDGARIEKLPGAVNGDNNGEHWKVTTTDGTQYFLGLNRLPGWVEGKPETQSTWTLPVHGNHGGEDCHVPGSFDTSWCHQAYRWNLDYSVDPRGNVTTYYYNREFNHYGRNGDAAKGTQYVRGGWLDRIEYGLRDDNVFGHPGAKVGFQTAERCLPGPVTDCHPDHYDASTASAWPDVPFDQVCNAGEQCTHKLTPSFFTRKRLTKVVTSVDNGSGGFQDVDSWRLDHLFLATGDGLAPAMNLEKVTRTGLVGGSVELPPTVFGHKSMANRVDSSSDNQPPLTRHRLTSITGEAGGHTEIEYSEEDCRPHTRMPSSPESNPLRCYPSWWAPEGALEPQLHWFHKYVVVSVMDDARTGGAPRVLTKYEYDGDAAWHFDEARFAEPKRRTWSQWRGYQVVRTTKGDPSEPQTITETVYGRGMGGDKSWNPGDDPNGLPTGTRDAEPITTSEGEEIPDDERLRGFVREKRQYIANQLMGASVNDPYLPDTPTATDAAGEEAFVTGTASVRGRTWLEDDTWRRTKVDKHQFTAEGIAAVTEDHGDLAVTGDESCTRTRFARNENAWILTAASQVETITGTCATLTSPSTIQSIARSYYDGQGLNAPPTQGLITKAEVLDKWDASGTTWVTASQATYDSYGRPEDVHDARGEKTMTRYTPATGPVRQITSTNPLGHVTTEYLNPAWGVSVASVDVNNRRADLSYDPLGRLTAAWLPGHDKGTAKADAVFEYHYHTEKPSVVVSKQLQENDQYLAAYTLYDGMLRQRQTQAPAPGPDGGRQITDVFYDSRGLPYRTNGVYWNNTAPASGTLAGAYDVDIPNQTVTRYDGMERPVRATYRKFAVDQWSTVTSYGGDRVHTTPPPGGTATTVINDAQGRTTEKRQYTNGLGSTYDTTRYTYNAAGLLTALVDPANNTWGYTYDLRGRVVATDDPDTGHSTTTYDAAGQVLTTTDSQNRTIANAYDKLGRLTAKHQNSLTGPKLASWEYDTVTGGIGMVKSSKRYDGNLVYHKYVTGYDEAGRPTGQKFVIPVSPGVQAATYGIGQTYTYTGKPEAVRYAAVSSGGRVIVPAENVGSTYNTTNGALERTTGQDIYVSETNYSSFGEVLRLQYGSSATGVQNVAVTNFYEIGTRRPERAVAERQTTTDGELADRAYTYDPAGNITKIADTPENRAADIQCFAYDHLRRMTDAWTPSSANCATTKSAATLGGAAPYWHSWTFDKTGNRLTETQHATAGDTVRTTTYPTAGTAQPHAASSVTTTGPNGTSLDTFTYDTTGRTKTRKIGGDEQVLEYDAEGRVSKIVNPDGKESSYVYDADGARLISREPSATTLHVFGQEIRLETGTTTPTWTRWYSHGGETVAVRNSVSGLKWLVPDHQGTNQITVGTDANLTDTQRRQAPYGALRGTAPPSWPDHLGFVGGRNDESGLTQVGARLYDNASGRFLSVDPVLDNNDPQQLNGYAYANNSPVTFSDPTGLIIDNCGPDGVLCQSKETSIHGPMWEEEKKTYQALQRSAQQQSSIIDQETKNAAAAEGIPWEAYQQALADAHRTKWDVVKEVAWEVIRDISGWNDIVDCFTKGDIWGCAGLVTNLVPLAKVGKILEAGYKAVKAVANLSSIVDNARGVLNRVAAITARVQRSVVDRFRKTAPAGGCHSFVAGTLVLMADGSAKPISEVEIGDEVKATDPETGETTDREVVATIVHDDEGDMTRLTVRADNGATGTVDATSWHPVWVDTVDRFVNIGDLEPGQRLTAVNGITPQVAEVEPYTRLEPVYDLTVEGVHTYYVAVAGAEVLVHNCGTGNLSSEEAFSLATQTLNDKLDDMHATMSRSKIRNYSMASAAVDRLTGNVAVGLKKTGDGRGFCAEDICRAALIKDGARPEDIVYSEPVRPLSRGKEAVCVRCEGKFGRDVFASGTTFESDGL
ncbi:RHS repeat-associated core domain-containing protein [Saccharothrix xinjiangensis]|uniref:RHS repeat-associated core domain-containing protein n=1 Tax=Saccharothrix xinjiangensis TaxID=204798 RepID=A0ABV9Y3X4_9PSEU